VRQSSGALRWTSFLREPHFARTIAAIISNRRCPTARISFDSFPPALRRVGDIVTAFAKTELPALPVCPLFYQRHILSEVKNSLRFPVCSARF
jgi:hypothetical protein